MKSENVYTQGFQNHLIDDYWNEIDELIDSEPQEDY